MSGIFETYQLYKTPETVVPEVEYEGTNASRFAVLATIGPDAFSSQPAEVSNSLNRFGFNPELTPVDYDDAGEQQYMDADSLITKYGRDWDPTEVRVLAWNALNEEGDRSARLALLAAGLSSSLERESVVAATAILTSVTPIAPLRPSPGWKGWPFRFVDRTIDTYRFGGLSDEIDGNLDDQDDAYAFRPWDGEGWAKYCTFWLRDVLPERDASSLIAALRFFAHLRVDIAKRSRDPIVRELSQAVDLYQSDGVADAQVTEAIRSVELSQDCQSTMVHGTWGWRGDWWYPGGDLHGYIQSRFRSDLYDGGREFSWSGALSRNQRAIGGKRFKRWVNSTSGPDGLRTVFAHSYGGEIVARAVNEGASIDEVVLLSAPIHRHHVQMLDRVRRVVDVRLAFDIVLTGARANQRLPGRNNVVEHLVDLPLWSHSATHSPEVWEDESIAVRVQL